MIAFLTLIYVVVLFLAVKIGIVKLNTFWKISPLLWIFLLFFVLFVPMQWGAPSGAVRVYQYVIEIIPNVSGEVIEVPVKPLVPVKKGEVLFKIDPEQYQAKVDQLEAQLKLSEVNLSRSQDLMGKGVGRQLDVDIYAAEVNNFNAQLHDARWELEKTVVKAPSDGEVVALVLRPGQRVGSLAVRSWLAFVEEGARKLIVGIPQSRLRHVKKGQDAEIVLRLYPGRVLQAKVGEIVDINAAAQLQATGVLPLVPTMQDPPLPYGVELILDEKDIKLGPIPGGAIGTAAIYTESVTATHVIRKVMVRMEAWMNYLKP
ncbi:MAG: biotin/lipoyl-binding protein [Pseudomonadota bacterium]|nr:biotin/lipoyl-binding protein [Pseudomonadota bacterium]